MSDQLTSKAGTITSGEDRFMEWKTKDGSYENISNRSLFCGFYGFSYRKVLVITSKNFKVIDALIWKADKVFHNIQQSFFLEYSLKESIKLLY